MSWRELSPEPARYWIRFAPKQWPAAERPALDLVERRIVWPEGDPRTALPEPPPHPEVAYLPPVPASRRASSTVNRSLARQHCSTARNVAKLAVRLTSSNWTAPRAQTDTLPFRRKRSHSISGLQDRPRQEFSAIGGQSGDLTITETQASDISLAAIDDKVRREAWSELVGEFEWEPVADELMYCLLECPVREQGTLYRVVSRAAFEAEDHMEAVRVLSKEQTTMFLRYLGYRRGLSL